MFFERKEIKNTTTKNSGRLRRIATVTPMNRYTANSWENTHTKKYKHGVATDEYINSKVR